jgi:hypothetical protein
MTYLSGQIRVKQKDKLNVKLFLALHVNDCFERSRDLLVKRVLGA